MRRGWRGEWLAWGIAFSSAKKYVSARQVAESYNVSVRTVHRRIADGSLTAYRIGPKLIRLDAARFRASRALCPSPPSQQPSSFSARIATQSAAKNDIGRSTSTCPAASARDMPWAS